jgi:hypothetical protein
LETPPQAWIGQGRFAVVDMGDNAKVANMFHT